MSNAQPIVVIQGRPDPAGGHLCHLLEQAYAEGARDAGRDLRHIDVARLDFPLLRSAAAWRHGPRPQHQVARARYPLRRRHRARERDADRQLDADGLAKWQNRLRAHGCDAG